MLAQTGHSHELNCRNGLLWQISSGTEFPIQFFNDSLVAGTAVWPRIHYSGSEAAWIALYDAVQSEMIRAAQTQFVGGQGPNNKRISDHS